MVTPFSLVEGTALAFGPAGALDRSGVAVVVSITDELVFFVVGGAGFFAFSDFAGAAFTGDFGVVAATLLIAGFFGATTFLATGFEGLVVFADAFALVTLVGFRGAATAFLLDAAPFEAALGLATALDLTLATAFGFAFEATLGLAFAAFVATLGLAFAAFPAGVAFAFSAAFTRAGALAALAPALDF